MLHPYQVSIVDNGTAGVIGGTIIVAKRSTRERAEAQATALREAIGTYNRNGVPSVVVTDLRETPANVIPANDDD
jgi:D-aminopeptidase